MPEASIVITSKDRYSDAVKKMGVTTRAFSKDVGGLENKLSHLNKNKTELKLDMRKARQELREAEKAFNKTGDAASRMNLELKQSNYDQVARNLRTVTKAAGETERAISRAINKAGSTSGGGYGGFRGAMDALGKTGILAMAGQVGGQIANTVAGSMLGSAGGSVFGSTVSMAGQGAAIGSMIAPGIGTAIGAALGGAAGLVSGGAQVYEQRDGAMKGWIQQQVEGQMAAMERSRASGSAMAAGREMDLISLSTMYGSEGAARGYLDKLVTMANSTPFLYSDLMALSKVMAPYGWNAENTLPDLTTIGNAGAALGWNSSDMGMVATALGRMKSSGKANLEYLNMLNDRGVNAVGILAGAKGVSQGDMYGMISKGQINGGEAAELILNSMAQSFAGAMERQSKTFGGLSSTVEGLGQELDVAMGEGYNTERKKGMEAQIAWLSGSASEDMAEANRAIGAFKASLENTKEQMVRDAISEAMGSDEYKAAEAEGDAAEMGKLIMEAKIKAEGEYNDSEGAKLMLASEISLIKSVREDATLHEAYWEAGYTIGEEFSKGRAAAIAGGGAEFKAELIAQTADEPKPTPFGMANFGRLVNGYAYGLDRVPYDNFPAILHEGEQVLTASEARSRGGSGPVTITIGTMAVREEADIDRVAEQLYERLCVAQGRA